jgi:hypothetical protein
VTSEFVLTCEALMSPVCMIHSLLLLPMRFWKMLEGWEAYSFTDGFSGYHQVQITEEDQSKTTFVMEWGSFAYTVMPFGLKNAPAVFSRISGRNIQRIYSQVP